MFEYKVGRTLDECLILDIVLTYIRDVYGIDYELEEVDDDRIGVIFTLKEKEHFMFVDEIVFNDKLEIIDRVDLIMDELRYVFELEEAPIVELGKGIVKAFSEVEIQEDEKEEVNINVIAEDTVEVTIVNLKTGEERELHGFIEEDVAYDNASELGYEIGRKMLEGYWN